MANDYYEEAFAGVPQGLARVENVEESLRRVESAFAKLPRLRALLEDRVTAVVASGGPQHYIIQPAHPPDSYIDGQTFNVRFPLASAGAPTINIRKADGTLLGAKPIRQVDGTALTAGHIAANARGELYYVGVGSGYFTIGGGARGATGLPGPPDGTFSLVGKNLYFTATVGGTQYDLGPARPLMRGNYSSSVQYTLFDIVKSGTRTYMYVNSGASTGQPVTNATYWALISQDADGGAMILEFRTPTAQADPGAGRIRFNSASPSAVTRMYVDEADVDANNLSAWLDSWDDTGSANLVISGRGGNTDRLVYRLTQVDSLSGYKRLHVTHLDGNILPANGAQIGIVPNIRGTKGGKGDKGDGGDPGKSGSIWVPPANVAQSGLGNSLITLTPSGVTSYTAGDAYEFILEADISAIASVKVNTLATKDLNTGIGTRLASLKKDYIYRIVYDGTRFILASLVAAILTSSALEFTSAALTQEVRWPYAATKMLVVASGGGGGAGAKTTSAGINQGGRGADGARQTTASQTVYQSGGGGQGGGRTLITVNPQTDPMNVALETDILASGGGGGAARGTTRLFGGGTTGNSYYGGCFYPSHGRDDCDHGSVGSTGVGAAVGATGRGGDGSAGGADSGMGAAGGGGQLVCQLVSDMRVAMEIDYDIGAGGQGGLSTGFTDNATNRGASGTDGFMRLYPIWA